MFSGETAQGQGGKVLILLVQIFKGYLGPGRLPVPACRTYLAEDLGRQASGVFAVTVTAENNHQSFTMDA